MVTAYTEYLYKLDIVEIADKAKVELHKSLHEIFGCTIWDSKNIIWSAPCPLARDLDRVTAYKIRYHLQRIEGVKINIEIQLDDE